MTKTRLLIIEGLLYAHHCSFCGEYFEDMNTFIVQKNMEYEVKQYKKAWCICRGCTEELRKTLEDFKGRG